MDAATTAPFANGQAVCTINVTAVLVTGTNTRKEPCFDHSLQPAHVRVLVEQPIGRIGDLLSIRYPQAIPDL